MIIRLSQKLCTKFKAGKLKEMPLPKSPYADWSANMFVVDRTQSLSRNGNTPAMTEPLLKIANHHTAACGDPPIIDGSAENCYVGYFENPYGEQWIFTLDRATGKATLRGGDVGWNTKFEVVNGGVVDLILGKEEQLWLQACWSAARKQVPRD